ncbi:hypothetical protein [Streptomyces sp. NPDC051636]|uniref:hypothetical protein n=1 Tax=Streptomyces sp. NPDC051636 TaxID=3365663 RepID=UPI003794B159
MAARSLPEPVAGEGEQAGRGRAPEPVVRDVAAGAGAADGPAARSRVYASVPKPGWSYPPLSGPQSPPPPSGAALAAIRMRQPADRLRPLAQWSAITARTGRGR